MAPTRSFFNFTSLVLTYAYLIPFVLARPWIVTEFYEEVPVTNDPYYWETSAAIVTTSIEEITPTVTSLPEAVSTITSTDSYYSDVTVIQKLYPTGVGHSAEDDDNDYFGDTDDDDDDNYNDVDSADDYTHSTVYVVNLTYSAPSGCSTQWTTTTAATVHPPNVVRSLLPKTAVSTSLSVDQSEAFRPTTVTVEYVWVDPTQVPSASLSSLSEYNYPSTLYSGSSCQYTGSSRSGYYDDYYDDDEDNWFFDSYWMGISPFALTMILLFGWIGIWLILGFIEAWVRFRRLMTGWQTRRGLPVCWSLLVLPMTLFLLCFFRKGYRARNAADAAELKQKWNDMSFWTKLRLFFVWGFRYKYPPMLGPAPARVQASKRPGKNPGQPLISPDQPAMAETGVQGSRAASAERDVDPEVGEASGEQHASTEAPHQHNTATPEASGALTNGQDEDVGRAH
ncbi:uncharacterized protein N7459_000789 [Penicillium hispanicum]|uniref:uncharacterized protein n=1 Tax=Penicillium hispanicum TaxID=1080232 RepID=UPI0025415F54|nr:uncharacterized protein N7459_000789 [Penicillium hispanicum]KAJ5594581.1 hypothetical protein N7459_000789 [Penicillium hispanicum]